jgi:phage tail-like protein
MKAIAQTGYFFANEGGAWAALATDKLSVGSDGGLRLSAAGGGFETRGAFMGGPYEALAGPTPWFRVEPTLDDLPVRTHIQLYAFTSDGAAPAVVLTNDTPFVGWQGLPSDLAEGIISGDQRRQLWIGGVIRGDGASTPVLRQLRVEYGRDTWMKHLPALYRQQNESRDFLERFLALNESRLGGLDTAIARLSRLFDPMSAPSSGFPNWLGWLSSWLAFEQSERWSDSEKRQFLAEAFELYGRRGTVEGLRRYLKIYAGVEAHITEPGAAVTLWSLGENSSLGFSTMLAPAELQGAVLGTTAVLDRANLATESDAGSSLFEDVAHHFCVGIWCAELTRPGALAAARAVIDREKPAHTVADLCLIEPRMRVGAQARVGIDAIVGNGLPRAQIGKRLAGVQLATESRECEENH